MFDDYFITRGGGDSHFHNTTVKEIKAPTDESLRLLDEFKTKAFESVQSGLRLDRNDFKCVLYRDGLNHDVVIKYDLNGKTYTVTTSLLQESEEQLLRKVFNNLAASVAQNLLTPLLTEMKGVM